MNKPVKQKATDYMMQTQIVQNGQTQRQKVDRGCHGVWGKGDHGECLHANVYGISFLISTDENVLKLRE